MRTVEKVARLTLEIPDRILAQALLQDWSDRPGVSLRILRGRISPELARFDLELRGAAPEIRKILRQSASWEPGRRSACLT